MELVVEAGRWRRERLPKVGFGLGLGLGLGISRRTGKPTAAVIRRSCRLRPSQIEISTQLSGTCPR